MWRLCLYRGKGPHSSPSGSRRNGEWVRKKCESIQYRVSRNHPSALRSRLSYLHQIPPPDARDTCVTGLLRIRSRVSAQARCAAAPGGALRSRSAFVALTRVPRNAPPRAAAATAPDRQIVTATHHRDARGHFCARLCAFFRVRLSRVSLHAAMRSRLLGRRQPGALTLSSLPRVWFLCRSSHAACQASRPAQIRPSCRGQRRGPSPGTRGTSRRSSSAGSRAPCNEAPWWPSQCRRRRCQ